ncbi:MAG: sensor histidine kinase, partial [Kocuria sp.]|nr:sensor histidine kinase [Kocuria sp.]
LLTAVALMVVDSGRSWGIATALVVAVAGTALHLRSGNGLLTGIANSVPVMVLLGFGIALGSALRAYEDAHARDRRTIEQRDDALQRLEEAITRLRRTSEIEKELLLADERARSARDLHDGLGHRLTLISMSLEYARRARAKDPEGAWQEVGTADGTAREALAEMRTWVRALSPVRDAEATGVAAFEAIAESFRGTGLEVTVETSGPDLCLGEDASLLFYRTVQEGLTNALRHGAARRARISLLTDADGVALRIVSDLDGDAVNVGDDTEVTPGFGLRGLSDRASVLGGSAHAARRGTDFELTVRIPRDRAVDPASCERTVPA